MLASKFQGWLGDDMDSVKGQMRWSEFEPKLWTETDVDVETSHCGICGSDHHVLASGWGPTPYPCVVGHEIIGTAVRVGSSVKHIKKGDEVGVAPQASSYLQPDCPDWSVEQENYCMRGSINTYGSVYPGKEGKSYGGYATRNRTDGYFVIPIPEAVSSSDAATMLCAGVTVFASLKRNGCGPGKKVGVIGIGGLGHFAILLAKALGADVVAMSRRLNKPKDALELGADEYVATDEDSEWADKHKKSLDIILSTVASPKMPVGDYLSLLRTPGIHIQIGIPDGGNLPPINAFSLISGGVKLGGTFVGSPSEITEMLELDAAKKIKPWIQERSMKEANEALVDLQEGKPKYRYVLINQAHLTDQCSYRTSSVKDHLCSN